jgi:DNA-binding NtrC family response regulator/tetratricopeptide (TPR) repeat protein
MSSRPDIRSAAGVVHACLETLKRALPLAEACLTDRRKVGVLLQAAGLLSLLDRAGWRLAAGWEPARVGPDGRLLIGEEGAVPGRSAGTAQELLLDLTARLFGEGPVAGRGEARRAMRSLLESWRQSLAPLPPGEIVARILDVAPFLWEADHAPARRALAGGLCPEGGGDSRPWLAGPRALRTRLLRRYRSALELADLLVSPVAQALWDGEEKRQPPESEEERTGLASALESRGRFEAALEVLAGLRSPAARALAARCHLGLGRLAAARTALCELEETPLPPVVLAELAETASRVWANRGKPGRAGFWIRRALDETAGDPRASLLARLAAAGAAWDRDDLAAMDRLLEQARPALDDPSLAWRWHRLRAQRALRSEDGGAETVACIARALRSGRRLLTRRQAAGLWNELGLGRARAGDLAGAERAFLHALHLDAGCDGPRKTTLALSNLAEIRIRRGRLAGVREILVQSEAANRRGGNLRGAAEDAGIWARFELALGRPEAALALCREARAELEDQGSRWHEEVLGLLAARALGWLGRAGEAAAGLDPLSPAALAELEPEERPAVLAHAGDAEGARREAAGTPFEPLWESLLAGVPPPARHWEALEALEPYRAARLVFDADLLVPGSAPAPWRREAIDTFRKIGALAPAERLEARDGGPWQVVALILDEAARSRFSEVKEEEPPPPPEPVIDSNGMVGESPALRAAIDRMARLAPGDLPVLILGESGTGKELAARWIHRASVRSGGAFVAVNCAALSETLLLSDLFGHARGAFTGADRDRKGVFETAHGGTVFLDEIGDLPLNAQGMLLRVLQEGEIRRLGESAPRKVDARVLAATHRDLDRMVEKGSFRRDLYYRLRVGCVELPPLRKRGEDVLLLADHFLSRLRDRAVKLSRQARARLLAHRFPGNVRELQNVLAVAAALAGDGLIETGHLELPSEAPSEDNPSEPSSYHRQIAALRRRLVLEALEKHGGHRGEAARELGVSRQGLSYLIKQLGLDL